MTKIGRPKKRKAERREIVILIRVSADEAKAIDGAAAAARLDRSKWAREALMSCARRPKITEGVGIEPTGAMTARVAPSENGL